MRKSVPGFIVIIVLLSGCSGVETAPSKEISYARYPESVKIKLDAFENLVKVYDVTYNSLTQAERKLLDDFIYFKKDSEVPNGRVNETSCQCNAGQTSCSASTWWSSCCVCCNQGERLACGAYGPFAFCRCENDANESLSRNETGKNLEIIIYPARYSQLFQFAQQNGINLESVQTEFEIMLDTE